MKPSPDIEADFYFNGIRKGYVLSGYRPDHMVKDNYITTGVHQYYGNCRVEPNGSARGSISFLMPNKIPHCMWIGKRIPIQEGSTVVGYAIVTRVINPILQK